MQAAACCQPLDELLDPQLFKALGDPTRAQLLGCLIKCRKPCSVTELAACCAVDFSVVSRHLALLARAGLLEARKQGRSVSYAVRYGEISRGLHALADAIDQCCPPAAAASPTGACASPPRTPGSARARAKAGVRAQSAVRERTRRGRA